MDSSVISDFSSEMSVHYIAKLDNICSITLDEFGIIRYKSSASVFKLFDTWTTNSINSELIKFEQAIKEFQMHKNTTIELYGGSLIVDSKVILIERGIRLINATKKAIAAICGNNLNLYTASVGLIAELVGHLGRIRDYCFFQDKLFSVSEDRTLKMWNLESYCCEYTSCILSKAALSNVDVDYDGLRVVVADEDNIVIFFELIDGKWIKELKKVDVNKFFQEENTDVNSF